MQLAVIRNRQIKMQLAYLHFKHSNILSTSDELLRLNFFWGLSPPRRLSSTAKVHLKYITFWGVNNANMLIAFLFADAFDRNALLIKLDHYFWSELH